MTDIQSRTGWAPGLPVIYASILATGEGKGVSSPCLRGPPTSPSPVNIPRIVNPSGRKSKTKRELSCSPAGPSNVSPDACRVEDQIHGRNGRPAGPGRFRAASLPPWPPPRLPVMSINQIDPRGLDPGGFWLSPLSAHPTPYQRNNSASIRLAIPVCASCPMVHGHGQAGGWRSGGHTCTHSQPATATRMHNSRMGRIGFGAC